MKRQFQFQSQPFRFSAERPSFEDEQFRSHWEELAFQSVGSEEWEDEVKRGSPEHAAWTQHSLNQVKGLRLAVDGVVGAATRSAVRSFQQQNGLVVDGVVGPQTEQKIVQALRRLLASGPQATCRTIRRPEILDRFDFDNVKIKPHQQPQISQIAQCIVASQGAPKPVNSIRLVGHTDPVGSGAYNLDLGRRRAEEVKRSLADNIDLLSPGLSRKVTFTVETRGERQPIAGDAARSRRVEILLDIPGIKPPRPKPPQPKPPQPKPPQPQPPQPQPPQPTPPPCVPPAGIKAMILVIHNLLRSLPLGLIGVKLPTAARCLTPAEQSFAMKVYVGSLDFTKILISDGIGAQNRPFTVAVPTSVGWHVVMLLGDISRSWVGSGTLIHELAHAWQSQHHGSDPTAFMKNSVECQVRALADIPVGKAAASASAVAAAVARGVLDPISLGRIGAAAAGAESSSAYAYVPGKPFGQYAAEQIAQQVEDSFIGAGSPTPGVLPVIKSVSANVPSSDNQASLSTISFHRRSTRGVVFH
jgi:outer membrane protein OmpA-like peptidoglycan-associated protein